MDKCVHASVHKFKKYVSIFVHICPKFQHPSSNITPNKKTYEHRKDQTLVSARLMNKTNSEDRDAENLSDISDEDATTDAPGDTDAAAVTETEQLVDLRVNVNAPRSLQQAIENWVTSRKKPLRCQPADTLCTECGEKKWCQLTRTKFFRVCSKKRVSLHKRWLDYHAFLPSYVKGAMIMQPTGGSVRLVVEFHGFTSRDDCHPAFDNLVRMIEPRYGSSSSKGGSVGKSKGLGGSVSGGGVDLDGADQGVLLDGILRRVQEVRDLATTKCENGAMEWKSAAQGLGTVYVDLLDLASRSGIIRKETAVTHPGETLVTRPRRVASGDGRRAPSAPSAPAAPSTCSGEHQPPEEIVDSPPRSTVQADVPPPPMHPPPSRDPLTEAFRRNSEAIQQKFEAGNMVKQAENDAKGAVDLVKQVLKMKKAWKQYRKKQDLNGMQDCKEKATAMAQRAEHLAESVKGIHDKVNDLIKDDKFLSDPPSDWIPKLLKAQEMAHEASQQARSGIPGQSIIIDDDDDDEEEEEEEEEEEGDVPDDDARRKKLKR